MYVVRIPCFASFWFSNGLLEKWQEICLQNRDVAQGSTQEVASIVSPQQPIKKSVGGSE